MTTNVAQLSNKINGYTQEARPLASGYLAILRPVSLALIQEAVRSVKPPAMIMESVPSLDDPSRMVEHPNPDHPTYKTLLEKYDQDQIEATLDVLTMFGVDLADKTILQTTTWLSNLKILERKGYLDLSIYDLDDPLQLEFVFKRYIAVTRNDLQALQEISGMTASAYETARDTFPGDA